MGKKGPKKKGGKSRKKSATKARAKKPSLEEEGKESSRRKPKSMSKKKKMKLVGVLILVVVVIVIALVGFAPKEYQTVSDVKKNEDKYTNKEVDVRGTVMKGSLDVMNKSFTMKEGGHTMKVVHEEALPDSFGEGKEVVVTGKLKEDGIFYAKKITVGCPSKYE